MVISSPAAIFLSDRTWTLRPSNRTNALGSQEWLIMAVVTSNV
jgi:hypothetical protein